MPSGGGFCRGKKDGKIDRVKAVMKLRRIWISCGALAPPGSLGSPFSGSSSIHRPDETAATARTQSCPCDSPARGAEGPLADFCDKTQPTTSIQNKPNRSVCGMRRRRDTGRQFGAATGENDVDACRFGRSESMKTVADQFAGCGATALK
jgi:hypothetical protein